MRASENPFRSEAVARLRYRMPGPELEALAARVAKSMPYSCLLGPEGTGKTTLMEDLEPLLEKQGLRIHWLRLTTESSKHERRAVLDALARANQKDCFLFDGGEILGAIHWWQIKRLLRKNACHMIATLHRSRNLPTLHQTLPDWELTKSMVKELCADDLEQVARCAFEASHGNVREVFRACYWACAQKS